MSTIAPTDSSATEALVTRLFEATIGALELLTVHLGWRLGLYRQLHDHGPTTSEELAKRAGIDVRYATEWLEQQAVAGLLTVDDPAADASARRYALPTAHVAVLVDRESTDHVAPFAPMLAGIAGQMPALVAAFTTGDGVPFADYGADMRDGQGAINRPAFLSQMAEWIGVLPDVAGRLADDGSVIADLGCGQGWSSIALARAFPNSSVIGVDVDPASIEDAERNAATHGATVRFSTDPTAVDGPVDLVTIFEALHDMADPVGVLAAARGLLSDDGAVLVVDERVADVFTAPGDEVERMMYGWSVLHCLAASRAEPDSAALGTVLRADTVRRLAADAGYASVTELDIDNDFFRFYRLDP